MREAVPIRPTLKTNKRHTWENCVHPLPTGPTGKNPQYLVQGGVPHTGFPSTSQKLSSGGGCGSRHRSGEGSQTP